MLIKFDKLPELINDEFYPFLFDENQTEVFVGGASSGKCFGKGTPILMNDGSVRLVEDIKNGSLVMGKDGKKRTVMGVTKGVGNLFIVKQDKGMYYIVNEDHILCLFDSLASEFIEITVKEYMEKSLMWKTIHHGYKSLAFYNYKKFEFTKIKIEPIGIGEYYGFQVDIDGKFLLADFTVTHNSYFVSQKIIYKMVAEKGHRWLACRKVKKDVRHSCYDLLKHTIRSFGFEDLFTFNTTETIITCKLNGNDIIGVGLDDVDKLKSFFDPTDFWLEEADQATEADYNQLLLRLRGDTGFVKQGILSLNPIWAGHWIKKRFFDRREDNVITHRSTYRTNKFLDAATKKTLESITDPYFKMVYAEGEWGVYGNVVFSNYIIEDFKYKFEDLENPFIGMDFGYNHASVIILGGFKDGEMYLVDELYGKGWTNADFIEQAQEYFGDMLYEYKITADSAEPDRIEEWEKKGYHIQPAKKGPGSISYGIDFLLRFRIHIHQEKCMNAAKEFQTFKRKEDREGNATDDFIEINNDCVAATRYGTEPYWEGGYFGKVADYGGFDMAGYLGL
jgi:phage terminase large subunit